MVEESQLKQLGIANEMYDFQGLKQEAVDEVSALQNESNKHINEMYEELANILMNFDQFGIPAMGIPNPDRENPMNLFKRQLKIEEFSFALAHKKYKKSLNELIKIGRADQLAVSHRYIIGWVKSLSLAVTE